MMADIERDSLPLWALLPKRETNAITFLTKFPKYDGRGIKIAILDSGIDPGAYGLRETSDGKPKIIDMMDASGAGDVDTSTVVEPDAEGFIKGITGRKLKIPESWKNPSRKYHIGIKNVYELYTKALRERMQKEYLEKEFNPFHKITHGDALRKLNEFQVQNPDSSSDTPEQKLIREDLQSRVEIINNLEKKAVDLGPSFDCVVFHDGEKWSGVIDTSEIGNLEECDVLGNYRECLKYATLSKIDMLNYAINIHDDGNILEIVSMSSPHGTHVASITAAYFPDEPEKNGVAPGAQLISIGIGDGRLGSMETGTALTRAFARVIECGVNVINMSYGEHSHWPEGRVLELLHDVVNKHGIIYVSSAGNHGPALTTIGSPPTMKSSSIIGVGAYVSPDMMAFEYSMRSKLPGMGYSWTSRGPTLNGDLGVSVCAPGGAITSVPNWTLKKAQLMNGTSMSAPNVTGCVALLLSGLISQNIAYSPYSVRRSLENTALKVANYDPFTHGHGLIQVEKAFDHLTQYNGSIERDVRFQISCSNKIGIYLRQTHSTVKPSLHQIDIDPQFLNPNACDALKKINFEVHLSIVCDAPYVTCANYLHLTYNARTFTIKIDPNGLESGVHFTFIRAYDISCPEKGHIFTIPVTIVKSKPVSDLIKWQTFYPNISLKPGFFHRDFIQPPPGSTSAVINIKNSDMHETGSFVLHTLQLQPHMSCKTSEFFKYFTLGPQSTVNFAIKIKDLRTLEVCFGKWWSSIGESNVEFRIEFFGLLPDRNEITMLATEGIQRVDVTAPFRYEEISPNISLKFFVQPLRPNESKIMPLSMRDVFPLGRQIYELILTYTINMTKLGDIIIYSPLLSDLLYESEYDSQLWMLFDVNKQLLGSGDAYPDKYNLKLEKGEYTLKLQIRHESTTMLEKLNDLPIHVQHKLPSIINLNVYNSYRHALIDGKKFNTILLHPHMQCPMFFTSLNELPKGLTVSSGSFLTGVLTFSTDEMRKKVETFPFKYIFDTETSKKGNSKKSDEIAKPIEEQFTEAVKDMKILWLSKLTGTIADGLFNELQNVTQTDNQLLLSRIQSLDADSDRIKHLQTIIKLTDQLLGQIKMMELLSALALQKQEKKDNSNNKNIEKQKSFVIEALTKKGIAICDLIEMQMNVNDFSIVQSSTDINGEQKSQYVPQLNDADQIYMELLKWTDPYSKEVAKFTEKHSLLHGHYGRALKLFYKLQESKPTIELEQKCIETFAKLKWTHLESLSNRIIHVKYPRNFRLF